MPTGETLALDACVAINLRASGQWGPILRASGWAPLMANVALREVLYLFDDEGERQIAPLGDLVDSGDLRSHELTDDEIDTMISLAASLGQGEAATIAIAESIGAALATDDRAAQRQAGDVLRSRIVTTPELLQGWERLGAPEPAELSRTIRLIEQRASFRPSRNSPHYNWWRERCSG